MKLSSNNLLMSGFSGMKPTETMKSADFMVSVGFIPEKPDMSKLFDDSFIKKVAAS